MWEITPKFWNFSITSIGFLDIRSGQQTVTSCQIEAHVYLSCLICDNCNCYFSNKNCILIYLNYTMHFGMVIKQYLFSNKYLYIFFHTKSMCHDQKYFIIIQMNLFYECFVFNLTFKGNNCHGRYLETNPNVHSYSLSRYEDSLLCTKLLSKIWLHYDNGILTYFSK